MGSNPASPNVNMKNKPERKRTVLKALDRSSYLLHTVLNIITNQF